MFEVLALSLALASAGNGTYCAQSYFSMNDIVPSQRAKSAMIRKIYKVKNRSNRIVGFVYELDTGERVAQGLPSMTAADRARARISLPAGNQLSNLAPLLGNPWPDLTIHPCSRFDLHQRRTI